MRKVKISKWNKWKIKWLYTQHCSRKIKKIIPDNKCSNQSWMFFQTDYLKICTHLTYGKGIRVKGQVNTSPFKSPLWLPPTAVVCGQQLFPLRRSMTWHDIQYLEHSHKGIVWRKCQLPGLKKVALQAKRIYLFLMGDLKDKYLSLLMKNWWSLEMTDAQSNNLSSFRWRKCT